MDKRLKQFAIILFLLVVIGLFFWFQSTQKNDNTVTSATSSVSHPSVDLGEKSKETAVNEHIEPVMKKETPTYGVQNGQYLNESLDLAMTLRTPWKFDEAKSKEDIAAFIDESVRIDGNGVAPASIFFFFGTSVGYPQYNGVVNPDTTVIVDNEPIVVALFKDNRAADGTIFHAAVAEFDIAGVHVVALLETTTLDAFEGHFDDFVFMIESIRALSVT